MKTTQKKDDIKHPIVIVDPKIDTKIHFPEKHAKAKEIIAQVGLPKTK